MSAANVIIKRLIPSGSKGNGFSGFLAATGVCSAGVGHWGATNLRRAGRSSVWVLFAVLFGSFWLGQVVNASGEVGGGAVPVKLVTMLTKDDQGKTYKFPSQVFYDSTMDEMYVLANSKLNIYNSEFYPILSLGAGRGAFAPQGGFVDRDGQLYLCQSSFQGKPARVTIFNAAFFPVREIFFDKIEGAESFQPARVAVSQDGVIYLSGINTRGVLVLDNDGNFLRWLKPEDRVFSKVAIKEALAAKKREAEKAAAESAGEAEDTDASDEFYAPYADIPTELMPKSKQEVKKEENYGVAPVLVADLVIDSEGHIYLLSEETSKVYVYSANEQLLFSFGHKGGAFGKMSRPRALAVDEKKKCVYIVDYMRHTVLIFDLAGKFMYEFGGMGWSPGWFNYPTDIALNRNGELYIADLFNNRVQVLDVRFQVRFPLFGTQEPVVEEGADQEDASVAETTPNGEVRQEEPVRQPQPVLEETPLPEPITPPTETEEESLAATGVDSPGSETVAHPVPGDPAFPASPATPDIVEEPIGAIPDNMSE